MGAKTHSLVLYFLPVCLYRVSAQVCTLYDWNAVEYTSAVLISAIESIDMQTCFANNDEHKTRMSLFAARSFRLMTFRTAVRAVCNLTQLVCAETAIAADRKAIVVDRTGASGSATLVLAPPYTNTNTHAHDPERALTSMVELVLCVSRAVSPASPACDGSTSVGSATPHEVGTHCPSVAVDGEDAVGDSASRERQHAHGRAQEAFFRVFEEQDDALVEMMFLLLQAELQWRHGAAQDGTGTGDGLATTPPEMDSPLPFLANSVARMCRHLRACEMLAAQRFARAFHCHNLFVLFLDRLSFDHVVVVDFLMGYSRTGVVTLENARIHPKLCMGVYIALNKCDRATVKPQTFIAALGYQSA